MSKVIGVDKTLQGLLGYGKKVDQAVQQAIKIGTLMVEALAKRNLRDNGGIDTGFLLNSIQSRFEGGEKTSEFIGVVGAYVAYAFSYEFGMTYAEGASVFNTVKFEEDIKAWARRKGIEEYAWAIITIIRKQGTKPHPFLTPAFVEKKADIQELILKAVRDAGSS